MKNKRTKRKRWYEDEDDEGRIWRKVRRFDRGANF